MNQAKGSTAFSKRNQYSAFSQGFVNPDTNH